MATKNLEHPEADVVMLAMRQAIEEGVLQAEIAFLAAFECGPRLFKLVSHPNPHEMDFNYVEIEDTVRIKVPSIKLGFLRAEKNTEEDVTVIRAIDWEHTKISVDGIRDWLRMKEHRSGFFEISSKVGGFRNPEHVHYAPELHCAVDAWEALEEEDVGKNPKEEIEAWVDQHQNNYKWDYALQKAKRIGQVCNWNPKGGANKTPV
jgi:hypothetical protein